MWYWTKNKKTALAMVIKKDPIRKHANELKVYEKTDDAIWGVLENKTNATSHPNIGSLKTAIEKEWNKMSEFILKACKLFWNHVNTIIEKIVAILSKFTVLCLSYFVYFLIKINLDLK